MTRPRRRLLAAHRELPLLALAAALGLAVQGPLRGSSATRASMSSWSSSSSTAIGIDPQYLRRLPGLMAELWLAIVVGASVLPRTFLARRPAGPGRISA